MGKDLNGKDLGKGYRIGHSYFTPTGDIENVDTWYRNIIKMEIKRNKNLSNRKI